MRLTLWRVRLLALLAVVASVGMVWAFQPDRAANVGEIGDIPELRTEFSRTFPAGNGRRTTQLFTVPVNQPDGNGGWVPIPFDSVRRCYPQNATYWTGNVRLRNNIYYKNSGIIKVRGGRLPSHDRYQGWAMFDLSPIPDSSTIDTVTMWYYCYAMDDEPPSTYVRLLSDNPLSASAQVLWTQITTGTEVAPLLGHGTGWIQRQFNSTGTAAVQESLARDRIAVGLHEWENNNAAGGEMYGFGSGQYTPYLEISYTPPPVTDISAEEVIEPVPFSTIYTNTTVNPTARWRNRQPHPDNFTAYFFFISGSGIRYPAGTINVVGVPGLQDTTLYFPPFNVGNDTGRWTSRCSTDAAGDIDSTNDVIERFFRVVPPGTGNFDVAAVEIISPTGRIDTGTVVTPTARWWNPSSRTADFLAYFALTNPLGSRVYARSVTITGLAPGHDTIVSFPSYNLDTLAGRWTARCSTVASGDTYPGNDWLQREFIVSKGNPLTPGWHESKPIPLTPSGKAVKDGGWLTLDPGTGLIYAAKGNKVGDFYRFDPEADSWRELALWKGGNENKGPAKGSAGVADGHGHVFAVKGNNTLGFWCYYSEGDSWHQLPDVPLGPTNKKVKGGTDVVYREDNGLPYVYLLKGYKNEFLRFNVIADTWEQLPEAPQAVHIKWDKGSWLAYDGSRYIYAHKAKYHEFWRFDCWAPAWDTHCLKGMPFLSRTGKTKKSKDGGSGTWDNGFIYALKGGNTCEFYKYAAVADTWTELDTIPSVGSTGKKKRVKAGGDIVAAGGGLFYALKGNKTREFWYYYEPEVSTTSWTGGSGGVREQEAESREQGAGSWWTLVPNPAKDAVRLQYANLSAGPMTVRVYNVSGVLVAEKRILSGRSGTTALNLNGLAGGVYLVRMDAAGQTVTRKLVFRP